MPDLSAGRGSVPTQRYMPFQQSREGEKRAHGVIQPAEVLGIGWAKSAPESFSFCLYLLTDVSCLI